MEKSIKRVENLVQATNSALARMKFNLMFDDFEGKGETSASSFLRKAFEEDELRACQNEFESEAKEMLAKMEKIAGGSEWNPRRSKKVEAVEKIKKINKKMNSLQLGETEGSRQKLLSLISEEKLSSGVSSEKAAESGRMTTGNERRKEPTEKPGSTTRRTDSVVSFGNSPAKSKQELKNKILETQEIVCRGFQTARRLAAKVENLTNRERKVKTPSTEKTVSEINLKSLEGKSESSETPKTVRCRHSRNKRIKDRHAKEDKQVEEEKHVEEDKVNAQVIEVKKSERGGPKSNLQIQRLPSLHIRGGLTVQRIHNLEIPPSKEGIPEKANTAISFLTHEQIETEKSREFVEKVWREYEEETRGNSIECGNCGKVIRLRRETPVDPRKLDEILLECNFNVFDPRIDEFVEKHGKVEDESTKIPTSLDSKVKTAVVVPKPEEKPPERRKWLSHRELSSRVIRQYKEVVEDLEENHFKVNRILQEIFRKVDESRYVFEECSLLQSEKTRNLTTTKPVVITWSGSRKTEKKEKSKRKTCKGGFPMKKTQRREPVSVNTEEMSSGGSESEVESEVEREEEPPLEEREKSEMVVKAATPTSPSPPSPSPSSVVSQPEVKWTLRQEEEVEKIQNKSETPSEKSENYYESDFESEAEDNPEEGKDILVVRKLSAILEVDSELEKRTPRSQDDTLKDVKNETREEAPLEDILSILKDRFARTESLAENLLRGVGGELERGKGEGGRSEDEVEKEWSRVSLSEDEVSSIGEIIVTEGKSGTSEGNVESEIKEMPNS